jgi:hypothetical protein
MLDSDEPMYALEQMLMAHLDEGARDQYEDRWEGAEAYITRTTEAKLLLLRSQIQESLSTLEPEARFTYFRLDGNFRTADEFDAWLRTLDRRMEQALAGDHSEPLVDPEDEGRAQQ